MTIRKAVAKERRPVALAGAVSAYEKRFGVISRQELADQAKADRVSAIVVRGDRAKSGKRKARRGGAR